MRISTSMIYELGTSNLQQRQQDLIRLQQQISSGRRMLTPSDDPVATATVLDATQSKGVVEQYKSNGDTAKNQLALEENALSDMTTLLQNVKTLAVYAGNPTLSNTDRASLGTEVASAYQQLLAISNRDDGKGQYLFSGYQGATRSFTEIAPGNVAYNGDAGQRQVQIGSGRAVAVNDSGEAVFRAIPNGNGAFFTAAAGVNGGSGIIDGGIVGNPLQWYSAANPGSFTINFHVDNTVVPPTTTYDIVDTVNNVSLLTGAAPAAGPYLRSYVSGGVISLTTQSPPDTNPAPFDFGASVSISGTPADGDAFTVSRSINQDMFTTLQGLITALNNGTSSSPVTTAVYQNVLSSTLLDLDNALDNVLKIRSGVGARLAEIDAAQNTSDSLSLTYSERLSELQDLDYAKAVSNLTLQQTYLQAAQQSFMRITGLSLFNLL